jgi:hypothetical protein
VVQSRLSDVISSLENLVDKHKRIGQPFTAWQSHCLRSAMTLFRFGHDDRGRRSLAQAITPPPNPPAFPYPGVVTIEELERAVARLSTAPVVASHPRSEEGGQG